MRLPPDMTPEMAFQSIGFTLAARTAIRICPGPAWGSGASAHSRTSGPPYALNCNARIHHSSRAGGSAAASMGQPPGQRAKSASTNPGQFVLPDDATLLEGGVETPGRRRVRPALGRGAGTRPADGHDSPRENAFPHVRGSISCFAVCGFALGVIG